MIRILLFSIGIFVSLLGMTQQTISDSLKQELDMAKHETQRLRILTQLADELYATDSKTAQPYAEEALQLAQKLNDLPAQAESHFFLSYTHYFLYEEKEALAASIACDSLCQITGDQELQADVLYIQGVIHMVEGNINAAQSSYQKCLELSEATAYLPAQSKALKGLADLHETAGEYGKALKLYQRALEISQETGFSRSISLSYNDLGRIYDQMGAYEKGLENYLKGLKIAEESNHPRLAAANSGNVASIHLIQMNYEKAREYANISRERYVEMGDERGEGGCLQTIGNSYYNEAKNQEALKYFLQAKDIMEEVQYKRGLSFAYFNLGKTYNQLLDLEKAIAFHQKSLKLREEMGYKMGIVASHRALGRIELESQHYKQALPHLNQALSLAKIAGDKQQTNDSYKALTEYYMQVGDFEAAFTFQQLFIETQDSLLNEDRNKQIANMQTRYETEKKEKALLESQNQLLEERTDKERVKGQRNVIIGGGLILAMLGFFGFQLNKTRRQRNEKIAFTEALIFAQEAERKRIARDLHDGVGQSLLIIKQQMAANQESSLENQELIAETLEEVRAISRDLHPFQLEKFGLTAAIKEAIIKVEKATDLFVSKEIENIDPYISKEAQIHIFRTIQESMSNIVKHASATAAKVTIEKLDREVHIKIQDNGKGFDHELAIVTSKSLGLRTMNERISAIGGKLTIRRGETKGTVIEIQIPA